MRNSTSVRRTDERGVVMMTVVLVVLMLGGLSMGLLTEGMAERVSVNQRRSDLLALEICETGILKAQSEIFSQTDAGTDGIGNVAGPFAGGTFVVTSVPDAVNPDRFKVTAAGTHGLSTRRVEVGLRRRAGGDFMEGLFAKESMTFNGETSTDAYDSRSGTYASQAVNSDSEGSYADGGGHAGSNGNIQLNGSSVMIRGNAIPGPLHLTGVSGGATVWGDIMPRRREVVLPDVPIAEFQAALATNNNATLNSGGGKPPYNASTYAVTANGGTDAVTLAGGTYFFSKVRLTGGATLRVTGPSIVYVTGEFDIGGGTLVNDSGNPSDLRIYAHPYPLPSSSVPAKTEVKFNGGTKAALAVYAPSVDISVGGNDHVFGSLVGNDVTVAGNSHFHYDRALGDVDGHGHVMIERLYWRELSPRLR